jgi:hypothetical protein
MKRVITIDHQQLKSMMVAPKDDEFNRDRGTTVRAEAVTMKRVITIDHQQLKSMMVAPKDDEFNRDRGIKVRAEAVR